MNVGGAFSSFVVAFVTAEYFFDVSCPMSLHRFADGNKCLGAVFI